MLDLNTQRDSQKGQFLFSNRNLAMGKTSINWNMIWRYDWICIWFSLCSDFFFWSAWEGRSIESLMINVTGPRLLGLRLPGPCLYGTMFLWDWHCWDQAFLRPRLRDCVWWTEFAGPKRQDRSHVTIWASLSILKELQSSSQLWVRVQTRDNTKFNWFHFFTFNYDISLFKNIFCFLHDTT